MLVCLYLVVNIFSLIVFIDYFPPNQKCKSMNFSRHLAQFPVLVCTEVGMPVTLWNEESRSHRFLTAVLLP